MPTINYRYSENEFLELTRYILSKDCCFVSDIIRNSPEHICINNFNEMLGYWEWLKNNPVPGSPGLYVLHDDFIECPLFQESFIDSETGQTKYYIIPRYGGPSIDICYFPLVNKGMISHYPYYFYETNDYYKVPPPEAMLQLYKDICKFIRKTTVVIKYYNRRYYCGSEYLKNVCENTVKVEEDFRNIVLQLYQK